jgi:hypothetical protein
MWQESKNYSRKREQKMIKTVTYGKYKAGTEVVCRKNNHRIKAVVCKTAIDFPPPAKMPDPVCLMTNEIFWLESKHILGVAKK